ncbi:MAG: glycosyltransferase family 9 protein [Verrucomicrobiota bacterium]
MNILLIRLKSIGDVVLTLPAVNAIRDNFPDAKITFLTSLENASLLAGFKAVDKVISLDRKLFRSGNPFKIFPSLGRLLRALRKGHFDLVLDFQGYGETAWLTRITGASQRWGSVYGRGRDWAYTLGVPRQNQLHHAERNLAILHAGRLPVVNLRNAFDLPPTAAVAAKDFFQRNQLDPTRSTLFLQPFTSSPDKDWPLENYLQVAKHWQAQGWQIIFGGGPNDRAGLECALAGRFITSSGVSLLVTGGLMQLSTLVLGGDTGALHLAVALNCKVLMLIDSTGLGWAFPFQHPDWAIASSIGNKVSSITVSEVVTACERVIQIPAAKVKNRTSIAQ